MEFLKLNLQMFGASASNSVQLHSNSYPSSYPYTLTASFTENSTSIDNNTSNISVTASLTSSGIRWQTSYNSTLQVYWYDNKTGSETLKATIDFAGMEYNTTKTATATFNVEHKGDGTLSGYAKAVFTKGSTTAGTACNSGNVSTNSTALTTIARASAPTLSSNDFNIGSSVTLTTNRKSTSFTHTIVLTYGSYTKTYSNVGASQVINTSEFASNMYAQIPNATSKTGTITTTTYNGSTQIGSASSLTFTARAVESNANPQISAITYSVDSTTSSLANSTTFIKGVTNATINVTANRRMSATLTKVFLWYYSGTNKVVLSSQNVSADGTYTFTINGISVSKVYGGATDTRGYTTYNTSINNVPTTFKDYVTLTADTNANIKRIVQTEPNVRINSFTGNYWNGNFGSQSNTLTIKWKYKETTASSYSAEYTIPASSISISNNKYTISNYTLTNGSTTELFDYQKAYHVQISVTDKIGTKTVTYTITAGEPNFAIFPSATKNNQNLIQGNHGVHFSNNGYIYWKEAGWGDKFQISPYFSGADDVNVLRIQGAVGGAGADPELHNLVTISGKSGNVVVGSISTKNLFDKNTLIQGDIVNNNPTIRLSSRQILWLNAGTYTFSTNMTSSYNYNLIIENAGPPPLSSQPTWLYTSGWVNSSSLTFTFSTSGYFAIYLRRSDNGTFTSTDITNLKGFNYQLETGSTATPITAYQNLNPSSEPILVNKDDFLTLNSGYTITHFSVVRIGKHYIGTINISKDTAFTNANSYPFVLKHLPFMLQGTYTLCGLGTADWRINNVGYCYFGADGACIIADLNNVGTYKNAAININYVSK